MSGIMCTMHLCVCSSTLGVRVCVCACVCVVHVQVMADLFGQQVSEEEMARLMAQVDANGDGEVAFDEFLVR
jgi:hypothetical protein